MENTDKIESGVTLQNNPEVFEAKSPEADSAEVTDNNKIIKELQQEVIHLSKEINTTQDELRTIRESLGLPETDEIPPSIKASLEDKEKAEAELHAIEQGEGSTQEAVVEKDAEESAGLNNEGEKIAEHLEELQLKKEELTREYEAAKEAQIIADKEELAQAEEEAVLWREEQSVAAGACEKLFSEFSGADANTKEQMLTSGLSASGAPVTFSGDKMFDQNEVRELLKAFAAATATGGEKQNASDILNTLPVILTRLTALAEAEALARLEEKKNAPNVNVHIGDNFNFLGGSSEGTVELTDAEKEEIARKEEEELQELRQKNAEDLNPEEKLKLLPVIQNERLIVMEQQYHEKIKQIDDEIAGLEDRRTAE